MITGQRRSLGTPIGVAVFCPCRVLPFSAIWEGKAMRQGLA
jgi:hypothetical protein